VLWNGGLIVLNCLHCNRIVCGVIDFGIRRSLLYSSEKDTLLILCVSRD
jgi:hypothetical protein